jgi:hypothetical protein
MFVATIRTEYRITSASPMMRFACVSDVGESRELLQDPSCTTHGQPAKRGSEQPRPSWVLHRRVLRTVLFRCTTLW